MGIRGGDLLRSTTETLRPRWPSSIASPKPTGPPPEMISQNGQREDKHTLLPTDIADDPPGWDSGMRYVDEQTHVVFQHVGKKHAGRMLDGVEHNGMPEVTR